MKTYSPRLTSYTKKYKLKISEKSGNSEANKRKIRQYLEKGGKVMNALKKLGICLSAMVLAAGLAVTAPKSVEAGTSYYETTKITDIKEGAGSSYDRVIELPKDAVMKVTSKKNSKWYKVEYQNSKQKKFKGYVKAADLQKAIEYKVKKDAYIREKAKQSSDTVYIADKGEKLFVVNTSNKGWYKVVYYEDGDVYRGYASSAKLKKISKDTSSDKKDTKKDSKKDTSSKKDVKYKVTQDVNMRAKANASSKVVTVVEKGDTVHVTDTSNGKWYKVTYTNSKAKKCTGYINKKYLKKK